MTITTLWSLSPDAVQVVLATAGVGSFVISWIAGRTGRVLARRWMMVGIVSIAALIGSSLIVTWLVATPPAGT